MAGGGVALIGLTLVPLLSGLFGYCHKLTLPAALSRFTREGAGKEGLAFDMADD